MTGSIRFGASLESGRAQPSSGCSPAEPTAPEAAVDPIGVRRWASNVGGPGGGRTLRHLSRVGDELGLVIDAALLEQLDIDPDTPLEITTDADGLIIRHQRVDRVARIARIADAVAETHASAFERLAEGAPEALP